jgi:hypothetical protein
MAKLKSIILFSVMMVFGACSTSNKPDAVADKFTKLLYTADFEGAKTLCTEESQKSIDFVAAFTTQKVADMKTADVRVEIKEVKIAKDGNSAVVSGIVLGAIDLKNGEVKDSTSTKLQILKQNGKWLVDYKLKESHIF